MKSLTVKVEKKLKEYTPKIVVEKIPKIKNCPKCQNEAIALFKIKLDNDTGTEYFISCTNDKCRFSSMSSRTSDLAKAIDAWNSL